MLKVSHAGEEQTWRSRTREGGGPPGPGGAESPSACEAAGVLEAVFPFLDLRSLARASQVSLRWQEAAQEEALWSDHCERIREECRQAAGELARRVGALLPHFGRGSRERLGFLSETAALARDVCDKQLSGGAWRPSPGAWLSARLMRSLSRRLAEAARAAGRLDHSSHAITVNFDIFELALRRGVGEVATMLFRKKAAVPEGPGDPRLAVIRDAGARDLWQERFGAPWCRFADFCGWLEGRLPPFLEPQRFRDFLAYFVDFPREDLVTTYRFQVLLSLFGPLDLLGQRFAAYVLGRGFVGLVNTVKAEELFCEMRPSADTVLIRFSRQEPELLAFTSFDAALRRVEHRRNADRNGAPIPIETFLKRQYPGYLLAPYGIDDLAARAESTFVYAERDNPYVSARGAGAGRAAPLAGE